MKPYFLLALVVALVFGYPASAQEPAATPAAEPSQAEFPYVGQVSADRVHVRAGDGTNYTILTVAKRGDKLVVRAEKHGWMQIQVPSSVKPWIAADYVSFVSGATEGRVTGDRVRIRCMPSSQADVLGLVSSGTKVKVVGTKDGWHQIEAPAEASAWISGTYVSYYSALDEYAEELSGEKAAEEAREGLALKLSKANELYVAELRKPVSERNFNQAIALYNEVAGEAQEEFVRESARRRVEALSLIQSLVDEYKTMQTGTEELAAKLLDMEKRLHEAEKAAEEAKEPSYLAEGWLKPMGRIINSPASHKLVVGDRPIYLLKSSKVDLNSFLFKRVRVNGVKHSVPGWEQPVIDVTELEVAGESSGD